jgi:hypothetical protein
MTWKPSDDVDQSVREWMKTRGWEVTRTHYDSKREVYAWRYGIRSGPSPTLGRLTEIRQQQIQAKQAGDMRRAMAWAVCRGYFRQSFPS